MRNKERLLSFDEPLRFIFSHSALVEGWDNPNVFTICNLQEGRSEMRKRQQIGRGLRLPVMENGERCRVDDINMLTVVAHEDFSKFAGDLQKEIEEETGVTFSGRILDLKTGKTKLTLKKKVLDDPRFQRLWDKISRKTTYQLRFETDDVVAEAVKRINEMEALEPVKFRISKTESISRPTVSLVAIGAIAAPSRWREPDASRMWLGSSVDGCRCRERRSCGSFEEIDDLEQVKVNPAVFIDQRRGGDQCRRSTTRSPRASCTTQGRRAWSAELFENPIRTRPSRGRVSLFR